MPVPTSSHPGSGPAAERTAAERQAWMEEIDPLKHAFQLFDQMDDVLFFAKDADFRLWLGNRALLDRYDLDAPADLWGKTDFELLPARLAAKFRRDDERIMKTGEPNLNIVELYVDRDGVPDWFLTHKLPVLNRAGHPIGIMGTIHTYDAYKGVKGPPIIITPAIERMRATFPAWVPLAELAELCDLSPRQFERRFKALMKTTPRQFVMNMRIHAACDALRTTRDPISNIATETGFYDQSTLTRQFRKQMGLTPLQYRKNYRLI